jgi:hypothetical protein
MLATALQQKLSVGIRGRRPTSSMARRFAARVREVAQPTTAAPRGDQSDTLQHRVGLSFAELAQLLSAVLCAIQLPSDNMKERPY